MPEPILVVENDPFLRLVQVVLDPRTSDERTAAFAHFMAHDLPDFPGWCDRIRQSTGAIHPAEVRLVDSPEELRAALPGACAVVVESLPIGSAELALASGLRAVQKFGSVTRNIDTAACAGRQIPVLTLSRRANIACAEHTLGLMLVLARKLNEIAGRISVEQIEAAGYAPTRFDTRHTAASGWARVTGLRTLHGATLGIVGLGEIGRELALRAAPFGLRTLYYQRTPLPAAEEQRLRATYTPLEQLLVRSDWVCVLVPSTSSTRNLIDGERVAQMKRGACLINISRPEIVDRDAIIEGLRSGQLGGLGLDTLYEEPGRADDPLLGFANAVLTPRLAAQPRFNALDDIDEMLCGLARTLEGGAGPRSS